LVTSGDTDDAFAGSGEIRIVLSSVGMVMEPNRIGGT
jgi:hypothetical protein